MPCAGRARLPHRTDPREGELSRLSDDHRLLRTLLSSPAIAVVQTDLDGIVVDLSPGAAELYGYARKELVGQSVDVLLPAARQGEWRELRRRLGTGEQLPVRSTLRRRQDGTVLEAEIEALALHDPDGAVRGFLSIVRESRRTTRVEAALAATSAELRARFEDSPVAQARVSLDGHVLAANRALERLLGRAEGALVGVQVLDLYDEHERPCVKQALEDFASGSRPTADLEHRGREREVLRADGTRVRTVTTVTPVEDAAGRTFLLVAVQDRTQLRAAEQTVRSEARHFDVVLQTMPIAVFRYDLDGVCTSSRGQALAALGIEEGELVGRDLLELYGHLPEFVETVRGSLAGRPGDVVVEFGGRSWEMHYRAVRDDDGEVTGGLGVALDVTTLERARSEVRANETRLRALLRHATDVVTVVDARGRLLYVSPAIETQFGYDAGALFWQRAWDFSHPDDRAAIRAAWRRVAQVDGRSETLECRVLHADGTYRWTEHRLTNLLDDPDVGGVVLNLRDISERHRAEQDLRRLAVEDRLTGLANRTLLLDRVSHALSRSAPLDEAVGLVLLDVVGLRDHNERLGHEGGDTVLRVLGQRLAAAVRRSDSVARVGDDEFAVLYEDAGSSEDLRARAAVLRAAVQEPLLVDGVEVPVRVQVGVALGPAADAGALLAAAESAVVSDGRPAVGTALRAPVQTDSAAVSALRRALEGDELCLHYQPVVGLADARVEGVEALVRWRHPERGLLPPSQFIPLAEASGLVVELGTWALRTACAAAARWQAAGRPLSVGVNLSPRQVAVPGFEDVVRRIVEETGVVPERLVLEVTESALMDSATALDTLRALHDLGVQLALDDFGTGYSSLTYLKRFPVDALKIDRSFVSGLGADADDDAIVASVVSLARSVGKTVVAEGVETPAQLRALSELGVDRAQGFLWSPALHEDVLGSWLDDHGARFRTGRPVERRASPPVEVVPGSDEERILQLHGEGASLHTVAAALNAEGRRTPAGVRWHTRSVARVVAALRPPT